MTASISDISQELYTALVDKKIWKLGGYGS